MVIRNPPPKPELSGFTTPMHSVAATVASIALPPSIKISLKIKKGKKKFNKILKGQKKI